MTQTQPQTPQSEFDGIYVTSTEIRESLGVDRAAILHARRRGLLPNAIVINNGQILLWKRADIARHLDAWKLSLQARRGELTNNASEAHA